MRGIRIYSCTKSPVADFAVEELQKYLKNITGEPVDVISWASIQKNSNVIPDESQMQKSIWIGTVEDLSIVPGNVHIQTPLLPSVQDPWFDDAIGIQIDQGSGVICGNQPRSVLLAVYRYLVELGCRFLRPGADGEILCSREAVFSKEVRLTETPAYRHRGICIEGSVSRKILLDMIDWFPKAGLNSYFIQFREAYHFFAKWYKKELDAADQPEEFTLDMAKAIVDEAVREMKRRGLLYQAVGHGWTVEPFGVSGEGWYPEDSPPDSIQPYLAEINGVRGYYGGIPINTNLCYSNPEVRRIVTDDITAYAKNHPETDVIHFWLADGFNNQCECASCREARPADFYVQMLNELDEKLTREGVNTKIVFLIYLDLMWPPETVRISNPDRFILVFAPIFRSYREPFPTVCPDERMPAYERNRLQFPDNESKNLVFLGQWQQQFAGDSFIFDYHYMWAHIKDPGYVRIADVLRQDLLRLRDLGLNGYISCQVQRSFYPHGLGMTCLGRGLWSRDVSFEEIVADYFTNAYGEDGMQAFKYFDALSRAFAPFMSAQGRTPVGIDHLCSQLEVLKMTASEADSFRKVIERNLGTGNALHLAQWKLAGHHQKVWTAILSILIATAGGSGDKADEEWKEVKTYLNAPPEDVRAVLDVQNAWGVLKNWFRKLLPEGI